MEVKQTLREKKRRASRRAFIEAARVLFQNPGFQDTTMAQIADNAGLHLQTLYNHFPNKQLLAATLHSEAFRKALADRTTDTLTFWREWARKAAAETMSQDRGASFIQFVLREKSDPKVAGVQAEIGYQYIYLMGSAIAEDLELDLEQDRRPILIANMLWGGNADAVWRWSQSGGKLDLIALVVESADQVATIVRGYQEAMRLKNTQA